MTVHASRDSGDRVLMFEYKMSVVGIVYLVRTGGLVTEHRLFVAKLGSREFPGFDPAADGVYANVLSLGNVADCEHALFGAP